MGKAAKDIKSLFKSRKSQRKRPEKKGNDEPGPSVKAENKDLQILREFDMDFKFGPTSGLTRLERWERAAKFDLQPPDNVLQILKQHENDPVYTNNVWSDCSI